MKTVLFCRVSSKEQEETGYSLPAQEKLLRDYSEKYEFQIARVFSISESASGKKQRQIFENMTEYVKKEGIKIIICEKVDRLTRNFKDAVDINDWMNGDSERQVHFIKENVVLTKDSKSNEKFIWNIKVSVAQYYIDNLSEEVKKGQKEKIAQGWLPTKPPVGYKTVGEKGHKIHIIDEEKAPLVKKMFELYASGNYSIKRLTEEVFQSGLRNDNDHKIVKSRIHKLLKDPFYIGKNRWNNFVTDGQHEALINKDTFDKIQALLKSKTTPKYNKHFFLFKGKIRCGECGGIITWETAKGHIYGHCNHYRSCSQSTWIKEPEVEEQLLGLFDELQIKNSHITDWIRKALKESHQDEIAFRSSAINGLFQSQEQIKQRLDRLYDDKLDGKINEEFYQKKFQQYSGELEKVGDSVKRHNLASTKYFELGINFFELSQRAKEIYLKGKQDERRELLSLIFKSLILSDGKLNITYTEAFQLLSEAIRFTNGSKMIKTTGKQDKIFEPLKLSDTKAQTEDFSSYRPIRLPREDSNL